jgi:hypothetical protein
MGDSEHVRLAKSDYDRGDGATQYDLAVTTNGWQWCKQTVPDSTLVEIRDAINVVLGDDKPDEMAPLGDMPSALLGALDELATNYGCGVGDHSEILSDAFTALAREFRTRLSK